MAKTSQSHMLTAFQFPIAKGSQFLLLLSLLGVVAAGCSKIEKSVQVTDESGNVVPGANLDGDLQQITWEKSGTGGKKSTAKKNEADGADAMLAHPPLNKEPEYKSTPRYCVVAVGHSAKQKMWLALDGLNLYVDLDSDGDLTDKNEKFEGVVESEFEGSRFVNFFIGDLMGDDFWHTDFKMRAAIRPDEARVTIEMFLDDAVASRTNGHTSAMKLNSKSVEAPVAHFGGAVTLEPLPITFKIGEEADFNVLVGTAGQGTGSLTSIAHDQISLGKSPQAEFSFPSSEANTPIVFKQHLDERC